MTWDLQGAFSASRWPAATANCWYDSHMLHTIAINVTNGAKFG
jgi:hypothetical protein